MQCRTVAVGAPGRWEVDWRDAGCRRDFGGSSLDMASIRRGGLAEGQGNATSSRQDNRIAAGVPGPAGGRGAPMEAKESVFVRRPAQWEFPGFAGWDSSLAHSGDVVPLSVQRSDSAPRLASPSRSTCSRPLHVAARDFGHVAGIAAAAAASHGWRCRCAAGAERCRREEAARRIAGSAVADLVRLFVRPWSVVLLPLATEGARS